jgi:hypothetical protein
MVDSLFFISGVIVGLIAVHSGYYVGYLSTYRMYKDLTQPTELIDNTIDEDKQLREDENYDWDVYDSYVNRIEDGSDDVPES